jgi:ABC-type tungstate transport system permease subunit
MVILMEKSKKNPGKKSPSRIKSAKEKIEKKKNIFLEFLSAVARGDQSYGIVLDKIIRTVKVFIFPPGNSWTTSASQRLHQ